MLKKFVLGSMVVVAALLGNACGDDGSSYSPAGPADSEVTLSSSSEDVISGNGSSSSVTESPSTSSGQVPQSAESDGPSSSEKAVDGSSSSDGKNSSSSGKVESSSSGKGEKSSSSEVAAGSISSNVVAGSSSSEKSSSSVAESSSSVESSSSEEPSSSSIEESSSSVAESSSSSRKVAEIKPNNYYKMNCPEGMVCKYVITEFLNQEFLASDKYGEILDERDGLVYKTIEIGSQTWLAQNMNYDTTGFCQDDIPLNCEKYGRIYNKNVAIRICPSGWHLPDSSEWRKLIEFAQKYANVENAGSVLKSQNGGWSAYLETNDKEKCDLKQTVNCIDGNGSDELGFSAVPQAEKANTVGGFSNYGHHSSLWMKKPYGHFTIYFSNYFGLGSSGTGANYLHSVRCIKD